MSILDWLLKRRTAALTIHVRSAEDYPSIPVGFFMHGTGGPERLGYKTGLGEIMWNSHNDDERLAAFVKLPVPTAEERQRLPFVRLHLRGVTSANMLAGKANTVKIGDWGETSATDDYWEGKPPAGSDGRWV